MINAATALTLALASVGSFVSAQSDPTKWTADSNLHQSLWGIAYTSQHSANYPQCGDTLAAVINEVQLMSQLTTRIRLYGSDCDQFKNVQQAIQQTKTNLHVYAGIYIDGNETTFARQRDETFAVLDQFGVDNILGITVGNEYLLQANAPDSTSGGLAAAQTYLISKINEVRTAVAAKGYSKKIPVGSADAGSMITAEYAEASDYIMANSHPFFSGVTIDGAAAWTAQYLIDEQPRFATAAGKPLLSAEIGWPSDAMAGGSLTLNGSLASVPNTQTLLDTFVCNANTNITAGGPYGNGYFWFELFDQEWKVQYGGAEPFWGIFDKDRKLKTLTIPTCLAAAEPPVGSMGSNTGGGASSPGGGSTGGGSTNNGNGTSGGTKGSGALGMGVDSKVIVASMGSVLLALAGGFALL